MSPGSIIIHDNFTFHDGKVGKKFLIVLGSHEGDCVLVKTTSRGTRYLLDFGCQIKHRFPNFHLVKGCCCLPLQTWVCLHEFYLMKDKDLLTKHFNKEVFKHGELTNEIYKMLCDCALNSDDISGIHEFIIKESLKKLTT